MPVKVGIKSCRSARECVSFVHVCMYVCMYVAVHLALVGLTAGWQAGWRLADEIQVIFKNFKNCQGASNRKQSRTRFKIFGFIEIY